MAPSYTSTGTGYEDLEWTSTAASTDDNYVYAVTYTNDGKVDDKKDIEKFLLIDELNWMRQFWRKDVKKLNHKIDGFPIQLRGKNYDGRGWA